MVVRLDRAVKRRDPTFPYWFTAVGPHTVRITCSDGDVLAIVTKEAGWVKATGKTYLDTGSQQPGVRFERADHRSNSWWIDTIAEHLIEGLR
jgi:hypothetical protein